MAFTVSHAVLAPILHYFTGRTLPIAAIAIGCMTPDLHRLFTQNNYLIAHQWSGIFSFSLWVGLFFCGLWYWLYRPVLYRVLGLEDVLPLSSLTAIIKFICLLVVGLLCGISTHLIWDGLTHVDFRTFAFHEFLSQPVPLFSNIYPMHRILQIGSSVLALPFIFWMSWYYFRKHRLSIYPPLAARRLGVMIFIFSLAVGLFSFLDYIRHIPEQYFKFGTYYIVGRSINEFSQGFLLSLSLGCILFMFLDRDRRLG